MIAAFAIAAWLVGGALVAPANHAVGAPPTDLPVVVTTIPSESGSDLATWYVPRDDARATIILLHANRGDRRSMLGRARLFRAAGFAVVMIDLQAHGESPGEQITAGYLERHDVQAGINFARRQNPTHRIGVVGRSLGGAAALLAAPLNVDALVIESVYPTIAEAIHDRIAMRLGVASYVLTPALTCQLQPRLGIAAAELCPIERIADVGCPILVAGGDLDQHTTPAETERMFASAREPKQLVIFPGASHVDLLDFDPDFYQSKILPFLNEHLHVPVLNEN